MGTHFNTNNFIFGLNTTGVAVSGYFAHWWVALAFLLLLIGRKIWRVTAPAITALITYRVWLTIASDKAVEKAEMAFDRVLDNVHPEVNSNSPPEPPQEE